MPKKAIKTPATVLETLNAGIKTLRLDISPSMQQQLITYISLLDKWNKIYNLTAIKDPCSMVVKHLLDSLTIAPYIRGSAILDVGTGAGLPGIPFAIIYPDKQFTLLDSNNKKTRFVTQAIVELKIKNVTVINTRVEVGCCINSNAAPAQQYSQIITRAVGDIVDLIAKTKRLLAPNGQWLFMKGKLPANELLALKYKYQIHVLNVPFLDEERCLISVQGAV